MMRRSSAVAFFTLLFVTALICPALAGPGGDHKTPLPPPTNVVVESNDVAGDCGPDCGDDFTVSWDAVVGAGKYSVDVVATYTLSSDGSTVTVDRDFSTFDTTINIAVCDLTGQDLDGDMIEDSLESIQVRVKSLYAKKTDKGNNAFSNFVSTFSCVEPV